MYTLEYLPIAMQDMVDIAKYISQKLSNPVAAERLANEMIEIGKLANRETICVLTNMDEPLGYTEPKKLITIARVIYAHRNYNTLLD